MNKLLSSRLDLTNLH